MKRLDLYHDIKLAWEPSFVRKLSFPYKSQPTQRRSCNQVRNMTAISPKKSEGFTVMIGRTNNNKQINREITTLYIKIDGKC